MQHLTLISIVALATSGAVAAQTTWIVDALNGAGAHFTDLPPAIAASGPGDVILIRYVPPAVATYQGATFTHGLTIAGIGGRPGIAGVLRVDNLPAGQHLYLRDLHMGPFAGSATPSSAQFHCYYGAGSVHLEGILRDTTPAGGLVWWNFVDTELVTFTNCEFHSTSILQGVTFSGCGLVTMHDSFIGQTFSSAWAGFDATDTRLVLIDCDVIGQFAGGLITGSPAINLENATLEIAGTSVLSGGPNVIVANATSQIVVGPSVSITGLVGVPPVADTVTTMGAHIAANGAMDLEVHGVPNGLAVLSFGQPTATPVPLWGDTYFLDPSTVTVFDFLLLDSLGAGAWQATLPPNVLSGLSLWLQSAVIGAGWTFHLTTPSVVTSP